MQGREPLTGERREGGGLRTWLLWLAGAVLLVFFFLNLQEVEVDFIVGTTNLPLIFALLIAGALGALVGWGYRSRSRD